MTHFNYTAKKNLHIFKKDLVKLGRDTATQYQRDALNLFFHTANTISGLPGCGVTWLGLIYKEQWRLISLAKSSPPGVLFVVLTRAELFAVPLGVRIRGDQPGVPAWLRGRLDWIRRLTAGPHLWRRRAERPPVCLRLHQVSIWTWRKDGASQRVSKRGKRGPLPALCGLIAAVHGPYTPLGITKQAVY